MDRLSNLAINDVVKKTDYNTKVTSIEAQTAGLTKNTVDNLADITKLLTDITKQLILIVLLLELNFQQILML